MPTTWITLVVAISMYMWVSVIKMLTLIGLHLWANSCKCIGFQISDLDWSITKKCINAHMVTIRTSDLSLIRQGAT